MQAPWTLLACLLLLAAPAAAQQQASFSLEQTDAPSQAEVTGGESVELSLVANLTGEGFSCTQDVEAPVNVTAEVSLPEDAPPNASVALTDASKTFPIPAGEYTTDPYAEEANATVSASAASGLRENVTATVTISSEFPGGTYDSCVPSEFSPASSSPAEVELSLVADDPPEPEEPEDNGTMDPDNETQPPANDSGANDSEDGNGIPLPWQAAPLAALGAALALRGREPGRGS